MVYASIFKNLSDRGIGEIIYKCIKGFLTERKAVVKIRNYGPEWFRVEAQNFARRGVVAHIVLHSPD